MNRHRKISCKFQEFVYCICATVLDFKVLSIIIHKKKVIEMFFFLVKNLKKIVFFGVLFGVKD